MFILNIDYNINIHNTKINIDIQNQNFVNIKITIDNQNMNFGNTEINIDIHCNFGSQLCNKVYKIFFILNTSKSVLQNLKIFVYRFTVIT